MNAFNIVKVVSVFEVWEKDLYLYRNAFLYNALLLINSNLGTVPFAPNHIWLSFGSTKKRVREKRNRNTAKTHKTGVQNIDGCMKMFPLLARSWLPYYLGHITIIYWIPEPKYIFDLSFRFFWDLTWMLVVKHIN
jgi:hypothetical protein